MSNKEKVVMLCHEGHLPDTLLQQIVYEYWKEDM